MGGTRRGRSPLDASLNKVFEIFHENELNCDVKVNLQKFVARVQQNICCYVTMLPHFENDIILQVMS